MPTKRRSSVARPEPVMVERVQPRENPLMGAVSAVTSNLGTVLLIVAAFLIGVLWTEVRYLKKGGSLTAGTAVPTDTTAGAQPAAPTISKEQVQELANGDNIVVGNTDSGLIFTEFSDVSCPFCHLAGGENIELNTSSGGQFATAESGGSYVPPVTEMRKLVDAGDAAYMWFYYPGHGAGELGALALYCANEEGKFWEAHDLLMSSAGYDFVNNTVKNDKTKSGEMAEFLRSAVNPTAMKNCIDGGKYNARLTDDVALARQIGVTGTPLFFVNTTAFPGAYSWTDMAAAAETTL